MNDTRDGGARPPLKAADGGRLDSWKKISAHFDRDVTTVQRWERREGMPVHRHLHDKQGSVYAFRSELDAWWENRRGKLPATGESAQELSLSPPPEPLLGSLEVPHPSSETNPQEMRPARLKRILHPAFGIAAAAALLLVYVAIKSGYPAAAAWRNPLANATVSRLTDWSGVEQAAEISRDGRWAAFIADRDGHTDAWLTQIGSGNYRNLTRSSQIELVNPSIRTLGFSADGSLVTIWTRSSDGSHSEDINLTAAPTAGGERVDFLPGAAEVAWSHERPTNRLSHDCAGRPAFRQRRTRGHPSSLCRAPGGPLSFSVMVGRRRIHLLYPRHTA